MERVGVSVYILLTGVAPVKVIAAVVAAMEASDTYWPASKEVAVTPTSPVVSQAARVPSV